MFPTPVTVTRELCSHLLLYTGSGCRSNFCQCCRVFDGQCLDRAGRADNVLRAAVLPAGTQYSFKYNTKYTKITCVIV